MTKTINLDTEFDLLPRSVRRVLNDCVWNWASHGVVVPWAPAKELVHRIRLVDAMASTGSNIEEKPDELNGKLVLFVLNGGTPEGWVPRDMVSPRVHGNSVLPFPPDAELFDDL